MSTIKLKGSSSGEAEVTVAAAAGTPTFTLPTTVGSANQLLKNSGTAGTLEYANGVNVDSSGRLLLGTTTEGDSGADDLTVATSGGTGITIRSGDTSNGSIYFSDGTSGADEYRGFIQYNHSNNNIAVGVNSVEKIRIHTDGTTSFASGIGLGNALTYAASNTLDDYEEGTWTPVAETGTVSATYAKYIKIGSMVTLFVDLYNFSDTSSTNDILVSLPFPGITNEEAAGAVHGERVDTSLLVSYINSAAYLGFRNGVGSSNYSYIRHNAITDGGDCNIKTVISYLTAS